MANATRTYFIRTRSRSRILATLICQRVGDKLAFGIARTAREETSASRKSGREQAQKRLDEVLANNVGAVYSPSYRRNREPSINELMGGVLALGDIVPVLSEALLFSESTILSVPDWAWRQDQDALSMVHLCSYTEMLCRLRNWAEKSQ